jgi:muconate cycloisomerase
MPTQPVIDSIETAIVALPIVRSHRLANAIVEMQQSVIVRLRCSDGIDGIGEATSLGGLSYGGDSAESIKVNIDLYLAPVLIGAETRSLGRAIANMARVAPAAVAARAALETALLDAQGKRIGVPVSALLGGKRRDRLPVYWTLANGDVDRDVEEAKRLSTEWAFPGFKLKIGSGTISADVEHVIAVKKALGPDVAMVVDVNQAWDFANASKAIDSLAGSGITLLEQPISRHDRTGLARLAEQSPLPIMADEAIQGPEDAFELARLAAADVVSLKMAKAGGLFRLLQTAAVAEAAGIGLYGGTMLEGSIGTAAAAHALAALPSLGWGTELFSPLLLKEDIVASGLIFEDGHLLVPDEPGLGITLDEKRFTRFCKKSGMPA